MKILLAEDDPVTREMLKRMLSRIADVVLEASDGLQAMEIIEHEDPDFLFTDVDMPVMNGYELIRSLRASHRWAKMPVVCLSSIRDREEITRLVDLGVVDYLLKPIRKSAQDRCRAIIAQHKGWRDQLSASDKRVLLLVEPDPNFRDFARDLLELDFSLIESASGADAARKYQSAEIKPDVVLIAAKLPLMSVSQLSSMLAKFASDAGATPPMTILLSEADVPEEQSTEFNAVMRRTFVTEEFQLEIRRLLSQKTP